MLALTPGDDAHDSVRSTIHDRKPAITATDIGIVGVDSVCESRRMVSPEIQPFDLFDGMPLNDVDPAVDDDLARVAEWFRSRLDMEATFAQALRRAIDEVLDGTRTRRYDVETLAKTEKTYVGTKVEIVCQAAFGLPRGISMDYSVDGVEVDAKFTLSKPLGQSIPREAVGHICLLLHADDRQSRFTVGLLRISEDLLNPGRNQDGKRTLASAAAHRVVWLVRDGRLPDNFLLSLDPMVRDRVLAAAARSGQAAVDELFKQLQGRLIKRDVILAITSQSDGPKRVRDARLQLRSDGILILGHQEGHPAIAQALGLPVPDKGSWISVRVVPCDDGRPYVVIHGVRYAVAYPTEEPRPGPEKY
jgi:hypothetical protein